MKIDDEKKIFLFLIVSSLYFLKFNKLMKIIINKLKISENRKVRMLRISFLFYFFEKQNKNKYRLF